MQKGFLDTALRVTAMAALIVVTLCVASFGLSQLRLPDEKHAAGPDRSADQHRHAQPESTETGGSSTGIASQTGQAAPDPLAEHFDRLGERLDEIVSTAARERSTHAEITRLADSMQAVRQQADVSGNRLQQEIGNLRVNSEVELRDLNRKIGSVSDNSRRLEKEIIEQRAGILAALGRQQTSIVTQVSRLEGGLKNVESQLSGLRTPSRSPLAAVPASGMHSLHPQNPLAPVPAGQHQSIEKSATNSSNWQSPVTLDSSVGAQPSVSAKHDSGKTATATGWKVSPMSHSVPSVGLYPPGAFPSVSLPPVSLPSVQPGMEAANLPSIPEPARNTDSTLFRTPLRSTLAPLSRTVPPRVPEILELSHSNAATIERATGNAANADDLPDREFDIQTTVIHVAATRPVDVEPAGVRMLNPALSATASGTPWTHDAVSHELLRRVSLRTDASIAGRKQTTIRSSDTGELPIGSSCPHCNQVHGFEAGDRLVLQAGSSREKILRFHVVSEVSGGGNQLDSIPEFDLKPVSGQTYVIAEAAVEGTVEESVATEKLVPIHGVLAPVASPSRTKVSTQLMQRLIVVTFRERNAATAPGDSMNAAPLQTSFRSKTSPTPLVLPAPAPAQQAVVKQLTRVDEIPVFLPPPSPASALRTPRIDSDIQFVGNELSPNRYPKALRTTHQADDDTCEICKQNHSKSATADHQFEESATKEQSNSLINWFRRGRGESSESNSEVTNADFSTDLSTPQKSTPQKSTPTTSRKHDRRYVKKPGNRRPVR